MTKGDPSDGGNDHLPSAPEDHEFVNWFDPRADELDRRVAILADGLTGPDLLPIAQAEAEAYSRELFEAWQKDHEPQPLTASLLPVGPINLFDFSIFGEALLIGPSVDLISRVVDLGIPLTLGEARPHLQ